MNSNDNIPFLLCSLGTAFCIYKLIKIALENSKSNSEEAPFLKIETLPPLKDKLSNNTSKKTSNSLPHSLSRKHLYQRKLDVYDSAIPKNVYGSKEEKEQSYVYKICLTGGPNAGKTTIPLITTITNESGGMRVLSNIDRTGLVKFQAHLVKLQMGLEDYFSSLALLGNEKTVIICDRGVLDLQFFGSPENWQEILAENDWSVVNLRDRRYDAVIHLVTSADGAPDYFKSKLRDGLSEEEIQHSIKTAIKIDDNLKTAWMGHPHYTIIDNSGHDFMTKINMAFSCICKFVGLPTLNKYIRKFLLENYLIPPNVKFDEFQVTEIFLVGKPNAEFKIRKRGQNGTYTYLSEINEKTEDGYRLENKKILTAREFNIMLSQKDDRCRPLEKDRKSFIWNQQLYVIDSIKCPEGKVIEILRLDTQGKNEQFVIPPFCKISKEVTDDAEYNSYELAKIKE